MDNEVLVTFRVRNCTYRHDFLRVQFFDSTFLHTRLSVGGGGKPVLDNWILEGDDQGNFPVNAFVFLSIVFMDNEVLVTFRVRNCTYRHDFPRVQFFDSTFLHTRLSVGGGGKPVLDNWILEGDDQGNFPVNAFVFLSIVFRLNFFGAKL